MVATELMVGDWVYAIDANGEKHPCRANNLEYDYTNKRGDFCVDFYGTGYEAEWPDVSFNVEPIPLTPEILEKNGFIYKDVAHNNFRGVWVCNVGRCNNVFIQFTDKVAIEIHNELGRKDEKGRADLVSFCRDWCEVLFVHELQHALRLCGIDKEIVV